MSVASKSDHMATMLAVWCT